MKTRMAALAIALVGVAPAAWPQTHQPYAGLQARPVKALSDQQIADLKAGRGMGLALAAELNGYPGPMHVLELATPLGLSDDQRAKVAGIVRRHETGGGAARRTADRRRDCARPSVRRQDDHRIESG